VQARYHYDAWGNPQANKNTGDSWNRFGFTGHEHDKETNLIYAKARFYDPDTEVPTYFEMATAKLNDRKAAHNLSFTLIFS
jgi:RHS repeat-associated protein